MEPLLAGPCHILDSKERAFFEEDEIEISMGDDGTFGSLDNRREDGKA